MYANQSRSPQSSGFVEVLSTNRTGRPFGYRLVGASVGPQIVVAGMCASASHLFDRLLSIPTLPWMRGNLILVRLDALDDMLGDLKVLSPLGTVDHTIILPWPDQDEPDELSIRRDYHRVLRACANLGMISGRGVGGATIGAHSNG